jgi:hypothetical protein
MKKEWVIPFRPSPACASREKSTVVILATEDPYLMHSHIKEWTQMEITVVYAFEGGKSN